MLAWRCYCINTVVNLILKEMVEPFDYNKAKFGEKVSTRDGRKVRIVCWDVRNDNFPLLALVTENDGREHPYIYTVDGKVVKGKIRLESDLVMATANKIDKLAESILYVKFVFKTNVGAKFLNALADKCADKYSFDVIGDNTMLLCLPFMKGQKLYSYMRKIAEECYRDNECDFKSVYIDKDLTFGLCGYYESFDGVLLGTRFVNKTKQDKSVREFFTNSELSRCKK